MYVYSQSTGELKEDGVLLGKGYSGAGLDKNVPADEAVSCQGPLPQGFYTIAGPRDDPKKGPCVFDLSPDDDNDMFGRTGFMIHGDSLSHPGMASEGCIVLGPLIRQRIAVSVDRRLQVIE